MPSPAPSRLVAVQTPKGTPAIMPNNKAAAASSIVYGNDLASSALIGVPFTIDWPKSPVIAWLRKAMYWRHIG